MKLSNTAHNMLWRAIKMGAQGFYTARRDEGRVCEHLRERRLLEFKDGRRSRGYFQFFVVTDAGRAALEAAAAA